MTDTAKQHDDGGPAFPNGGDNIPEYPYYDGMTLRDYFAGQALVRVDLSDTTGFREIGVLCYKVADAMLAERERRKGAEDAN